MGEEDIEIAAASNGKAKCSKSETKGLTGPLAGLTSAWGRLEHPGKGRASRRQEGSGPGAGSGADPCLHPRAGTAAFNPAVRVVQRSALRGGAAVPPPAPCGGVAAVVMERAALLRRVPPAPPRRPRPLSDAAPSCPPAARPVPPCPGRGQSPWRGAAAGRPLCRAGPCPGWGLAERPAVLRGGSAGARRQPRGAAAAGVGSLSRGTHALLFASAQSHRCPWGPEHSGCKQNLPHAPHELTRVNSNYSHG